MDWKPMRLRSRTEVSDDILRFFGVNPLLYDHGLFSRDMERRRPFAIVLRRISSSRRKP